jgi:hypothetical protein
MMIDRQELGGYSMRNFAPQSFWFDAIRVLSGDDVYLFAGLAAV